MKYDSLLGPVTKPAGLTMSSPWRRFCIMATLALGVMFWLSSKGMANNPRPPISIRNVQDSTQNTTLGFGAIFIGVMPHRTDQMDAISLLSHFSGLDMTVVPGVDPSTVAQVALPPGDYRPILPSGHLTGHIGVWRTHLNMLKMVVDQKLESALLLEGDIDWDVRIKSQFGKISVNLNDRSPEYPYGRNWDTMWVGHCRHIANESNHEPIAVFADETVAPRNYLKKNIQEEFLHHGVNKDGRRMISNLFAPTCTGGYAVTLAGAIKILYHMGLVMLRGPYDEEFCWMVQIKPYLLNGIVITPPLFVQHKTGTRKDSDIETTVQNISAEVNERVCPNCVTKSVRGELYSMIYPGLGI